ncbi:MAG: cytochrome c [Candidatus Magnetobacterium sp. LHC-1]|uniref:Cytochrome c n=1 Tax=Candidatus Magnetobacterium casense TaxID=1455061 RepID=A0ABS6S3W2_9BACT|nr:cytochrome c [Candidatus Magnetobacterium casensis]MBF0609161.1 cytochrome c [Nitrospirota bacterium]MBV6343098.1 cytochrome c [Candidatus Magnetobacterium casensis]
MKQRTVTKMASVLLAALFLFVAVQASWGHQNREEHAASPLLEEMVKLNSAFTEIVSGVALGDAERVHKALEPLHGTLEKTHEGIKTGSVHIPKNQHNIKEFVKLDREFHKDLEKLAVAAQQNNQEAMLKLTNKLLGGCVNCHRKFRQ